MYYTIERTTYIHIHDFAVFNHIRFDSIPFQFVRFGFGIVLFCILFKCFNRALSFIAAIHYILAIIFHDFTVVVAIFFLSILKNG